MNKQRKVLITITYNEMGIIIDTKAEEVAQPNLQPTCNQLATDAISRQAAIEAIEYVDWYHQNQHGEMVSGANSREHQAWYRAEDIYDVLERLPSAQPEIIRCKDCEDYQTDWETDYPNEHYCATVDKMMPEDGFCSSAERRIDETD